MADSNKLELPSLQKLQSAEQMELLDVIDSLRARGLSEIVALPQLIVCGDQSSGKSSVLEAISGIPFPRQDNLCTRFATEVVLRRAAKDEISVSILPGKERTQTDRDRLLQFRHELNTRDDLAGLFDIAKDAMRLPGFARSFSNDVLRIEFCGPSQPQLTLVDLPGLIHSETKSQTIDDIKLVHSLVTQYLQNPRSIILAVVSAKNDIGNQVILHRAREVDPLGLRTLGIITKPDTLVKGSKSEEAFIALARNEEVKFSLGWHVVKNLDSATEKNQNNSRDKQEDQYFKESNFSLLPPHTLGITFLRSRLSKVLFDQIRKELPRLVDDIESQISAGKAGRDKLGPSRAEIQEQRSFLISLSESFHSICRDAVRGDYDHKFFQDDTNPERRLCANVMNMHFTFAENMRKQGASWTIQDKKSNNRRCRTREEAIKEACILLKRSRGRELPGLANPLLVGELFREYSRPWGDLARLHIKNVWETTNRFLELLLKHLADDDTSEKILRFWLYPIMEEKLALAYVKLNELLDVHKDHPMTTNNQFISKNRSRQQNTKDELDKKMRQEFPPGYKLSIEEVTRLLSTMGPKADPDMDMIAAEEAFDNMNAFYDVALNLFTDNVPTLAIQAPIIREIPKILCPTAVFSMDVNVVKKIAGETEEKALERAAILRRLEILENGARICKQYAKRPHSVVASSPEKAKPKNAYGRQQNNSRLSSESVLTTPMPNNTSSNPFHSLGQPRDVATSASVKSSAGLAGSGSPASLPTKPSNGFSFASSEPTSNKPSSGSGGLFSEFLVPTSTKSSGGIFGSVPSNSKSGSSPPGGFGSRPSGVFGSSSNLSGFGVSDSKATAVSIPKSAVQDVTSPQLNKVINESLKRIYHNKH